MIRFKPASRPTLPLWFYMLTGVACVRGKRAAQTEGGEARAEAPTVQGDDFSAGELATFSRYWFSFSGCDSVAERV